MLKDRLLTEYGKITKGQSMDQMLAPVEARFQIQLSEQEVIELRDIPEVVWYSGIDDEWYEIVFNPLR
jgi:hypothetical protein